MCNARTKKKYNRLDTKTNCDICTLLLNISLVELYQIAVVQSVNNFFKNVTSHIQVKVMNDNYSRFNYCNSKFICTYFQCKIINCKKKKFPEHLIMHLYFYQI